jgi:phosphoserine phosphatase RsbU/P
MTIRLIVMELGKFILGARRRIECLRLIPIIAPATPFDLALARRAASPALHDGVVFVPMLLADPQLTANDVLRAFQRDEPFLFLGSAFAAVGIVSIAFCVLRRRFDALLVWLAIFAGIYGLRMWLQSHILRIEFHENFFYERLRLAITYLVPIPAFIFFREAGFLGSGRKITRLALAINIVFFTIFVSALLLGPMRGFDAVNGAVVTGALWILLVRSLSKKAKHDRDFAVVRIGVVCFVALALWDNIIGEIFAPSKVEPYGFAVLLGCLGYVAARRSLARDVELGEIHQELELAKRIQLSILPGGFPQSVNFTVAARYVPMSSVAGDLYDYLITGENQAGLLIADVSGHGVPAALIASMVKMAATSQRINASHPALLLTNMNTALCGNTQGQFVTAAYVHLDAEAGELRYSAAGHPSMLLLRNETVSEVIENGLLLAASETATYSEKTLLLEPGDRLLLYTDGLVEARNAEGKLFGEDSLIAALRDTRGLTPGQGADRLIASAQAWAVSQDDDLTVLVCDYQGVV